MSDHTSTPNHTQPSTCVYFIDQVGTPYLKIGITEDLPRRLSTLQTASPQDLRVICTLECGDIETAQRIEGMLHAYFEAQYVRGEWFSITAVQALALITLAENMRDELGAVVVKRAEYAEYVFMDQPGNTAKQRVVNYLREHPKIMDQLVNYEIQQTEVASVLGVSQASVSRGLSMLQSAIAADLEGDYRRGD